MGGKQGWLATLVAVLVLIATILIAAVPLGSLASYMKIDWAVNFAIIRAETKNRNLPGEVTIGMFRMCYATPGYSCLGFSITGANINQFSFEGAEKWVAIMPHKILLLAWPILGACAIFFTIIASFCFCCPANPCMLLFGVLGIAVDIAYLTITAVIYFILQNRIGSSTDYRAKWVPLTALICIAAVVFVVIVPVILAIWWTPIMGDSQIGARDQVIDLMQRFVYHQQGVPTHLTGLMRRMAHSDHEALGAFGSHGHMIAEAEQKRRSLLKNPYYDSNDASIYQDVLKVVRIRAEEEDSENQTTISATSVNVQQRQVEQSTNPGSFYASQKPIYYSQTSLLSEPAPAYKERNDSYSSSLSAGGSSLPSTLFGSAERLLSSSLKAPNPKEEFYELKSMSQSRPMPTRSKTGLITAARRVPVTRAATGFAPLRKVTLGFSPPNPELELQQSIQIQSQRSVVSRSNTASGPTLPIAARLQPNRAQTAPSGNLPLLGRSLDSVLPASSAP